MNSRYSTTNLGLFTLERCDNYNCDKWPSVAWRVQSHKILKWHPCGGPFQFTRISAVLSWLGQVWEDLTKVRAPRDYKKYPVFTPVKKPIDWVDFAGDSFLFIFFTFLSLCALTLIGVLLWGLAKTIFA